MTITTAAATRAKRDALTQLVKNVGGYIESTYQSGDRENGSTRSSSMTLRIPSEKLDEFLNGLDGVGRVVDRSESSTDMTVQYADNEARLATLRAKLERLNAIAQLDVVQRTRQMVKENRSRGIGLTAIDAFALLESGLAVL